jgi:pimeloyl-ACP methyl ester carboxylesterase
MNVSLTTSIEPHFRTIDGLRIRYAESSGSQDPVVLLTSPWPESLYAFAPMWATLAQNARLLAVDLPGFGASERREDLLSPRAMGGFLAELIAEADLGMPHRRAGRGDLGRPVSGGGASGADRERDRRHRRSCGSAPAR